MSASWFSCADAWGLHDTRKQKGRGIINKQASTSRKKFPKPGRRPTMSCLMARVQQHS